MYPPPIPRRTDARSRRCHHRMQGHSCARSASIIVPLLPPAVSFSQKHRASARIFRASPAALRSTAAPPLCPRSLLCCGQRRSYPPHPLFRENPSFRWKTPCRTAQSRTDTALFPARTSRNNGSRGKYLPHRNSVLHSRNSHSQDNRTAALQSCPAACRTGSRAPSAHPPRRCRPPARRARHTESLLDYSVSPTSCR